MENNHNSSCTATATNVHAKWTSSTPFAMIGGVWLSVSLSVGFYVIFFVLVAYMYR